MALSSLRRHQKRIMTVLAPVIIITFVFLWGGERSRSSGDGETIAVLGGEEMGVNEYRRYRRVLLRLRPVMGVDSSESGPFIYRMRAILARRAGISVSGEQLKLIIKRIMAHPMWVGSESFAEADYLAALKEHNILAADFEAILEDILLGEAASEATVQASYLTEDEEYLAYCRERDQIKIKTKDFLVKTYEKDVEEVTEDDMKAYHNRHKGDAHGSPTALSTDPEVAVAYGFVSKGDAEGLLKLHRKASPIAHVEDLLAGPLGAIAAEAEALASAAVRENDLRRRYDSVKKLKYKLPSEKKDEKKEKKAAAETTEAAAPAVEEVKYKPFEEVRAELETEMSKNDGSSAANRQVRSVIDLANEWSKLRPVGADAFISGLTCAPIPALDGIDRLVEDLEFASACNKSGARYGVTMRKKEDALKRQLPMGKLHSLAGSAIGQARRGDGNVGQWPITVENGAVAWKISDYLAPRPLTFDESKDTAKKRIVHMRAAKLAQEAALKFTADLEDGAVDDAGMVQSSLMSVRSPRARPFAMLGVREAPEAPVAIRKDRDAPVETDRTPEEMAYEQTGKYRVAIVSERKSPSKDDFAKETSWRERSARRLRMIRHYFMADHWSDRVNDMEFIRNPISE